MKVKTENLKIGDVIYPFKFESLTKGSFGHCCGIVDEILPTMYRSGDFKPITPVIASVYVESAEKCEYIKLNDDTEFEVIYRKDGAESKTEENE